MDHQIAEFVERMGLLTEGEGFPRIAGRIFGLLLVTPAECSLDEIAESLGVSKASVSTDARRLEQLGFIERVSRPGDRRDYYRISPEGFERSLDSKLERVRRVRALLHDARGLPIRSPAVRQRLEHFEQVYEAIVEAVEHTLETWRARRAGPQRRARRA